MRIIAKRTLRQFWLIHTDARGSLEAWHAEVSKAAWTTPQQVARMFGSASVLKSGRVVFIIAGNKYRLVVAMDYGRRTCFVKFIGTLAQYDDIDAETTR